MGIGGQVTALLKHEYPSMIEESRSKKYFAKKWAHYDIIEDEDGMTAADRFKEELWSIYSVEDELMPRAEYVLDRLAAKQCRNMMYELRVDAVKEYYDTYLQQRIKDSEARQKLLRQAQYAKVKPDWISEAAWRAICAYWCSPEYFKKRRLAQDSRNQVDFAQNRGGSRPYAQTKQYLGKTYGPEAATDMNTFCSMKSGVKNCDSNGNSGPIPSQKTKQRIDDYYTTLEAEHPDDFEQLRSDGQLDPVVVFKSSGCGLAHGRLPIANSAIRKSEIKGSGRRDVFEKLNMELLAEIADILQSVNANASMPPVDQVTESSHAGDAGFGGLQNNGIKEDEGNANTD
ncbi:uncharacterized protein LOC8078550 [Sorghum bicolor]|uniref:uncharacterized protein LOC8078550 n=1 Tax=Sorghum bicolor TaxID=4558 RepID=UPI000B4258FE|nr:uncharacterized protein LOC8078550 [Sorghum bicolor]|eukprot:XP_021309309.1 uncharacterized protein LOC8078550 [Sorghum bicolor]